MGKNNFITKTYYDSYEKFKCPFNVGFWHYSPHGCCIFLNKKTKTIHHLYLCETCTLSRNGLTLSTILLQKKNNNNIDILFNDYKGLEYEEDDDDDDENNNNNNNNSSNRFLKVQLYPYLNNFNLSNETDVIHPNMLKNFNETSREKILNYQDEIMQQRWFIVCDLQIPYKSLNFKNINEKSIHYQVIKNIFCPLVFCASLETFSSFLENVTIRFFTQQLPLINNMSSDKLMKKLSENINFIEQSPAQRMVTCLPNNNIYYMDARDLFDVLKMGNSEFITNMRSVHISNELNFLDTWRRILFNFIYELVNVHNFDRQSIRIRSNCNVNHFIKGNNKSVIPEFRCKFENRSKCMHLKTLRYEYEIYKTHNISENKLDKTKEYTIALSSKGVICRYVLETLVEEYGEEAVDKEFSFICFFNTTMFESQDSQLWEHIIYESLDVKRKFSTREGSLLARERIACMQELCNEKRMNDIHRFCLPKRFLTLYWFEWVMKKLKINVFEDN